MSVRAFWACWVQCNEVARAGRAIDGAAQPLVRATGEPTVTPSKKPKAITGPSRELIARIEHLQSLLRGLPNSLPENPPDSPYRFYLDDGELEDRGYLGELSHALEVCVVPGKPEYNLSYASLTSRATRKALREYLKTDPTLANEIKQRCGATHLDELPSTFQLARKTRFQRKISIAMFH
ncbi:hypothetical protein B0H10DRAFT_1962832 [Mycena sp. CBHHK59/15]|nr:hypothetical protein B0H10DRAFT_1962832 [Mycena sp. CBHHK59/15]